MRSTSSINTICNKSLAIIFTEVAIPFLKVIKFTKLK
jgi:hypothetical protein